MIQDLSEGSLKQERDRKPPNRCVLDVADLKTRRKSFPYSGSKSSER